MPANTELGKIPVQIIEIDQDYCSLSYGVGACNADTGVSGNAKCYNTYATCKSKDDYTLGTPLTISFAKPQSDLPDEYLIPSVQSVSTSPTRINVGGRSGRDKPLGKRAQVSVNLQDHPHSDVLVDPYLTNRSYNPLENGTFWSKWLKRNPYYNGRSLRVKNGYYGQDLADYKTKHYVIESISLPDSRGKVTIKAQDVLRLADDDKAQAPSLSNGKLLADLNDTATTFTVTGGDISEYNQNSTQAVRINDEIIRYTSLTVDGSGDLVFSGATRASDGTEAQTHETDDNVQACLEYDNVRPDLIAKDLLLNYGNIDAAYIDDTAWSDEGTTWYGSIDGTRLLTEPVGVTQLLGELSEQFLFYIWWDEVEQLINFKAVAPQFETPPAIDEENNILQNSAGLKADDELRVSEIWLSYLLKTPIEKIKERDSYKRVYARIDKTASSEFEYGERKVYEVYSGWIDNDTIAILLTQRLLTRYRNNPIRLTFELDAKDRDLITVGQVFDITYRAFVDDNGVIQQKRYQAISVEETVAGEKIKVEAIKFDFDITFNASQWMASDAPTYDLATEPQKQNGAWWADADGKIDGSEDNAYQWS
jgi:hypothetical protein